MIKALPNKQLFTDFKEELSKISELEVQDIGMVLSSHWVNKVPLSLHNTIKNISKAW
jgi:hypothetical protein